MPDSVERRADLSVQQFLLCRRKSVMTDSGAEVARQHGRKLPQLIGIDELFTMLNLR